MTGIIYKGQLTAQSARYLATDLLLTKCYSFFMDIKSPGSIGQTSIQQAGNNPEGLAQTKASGSVFTALVESSIPVPQARQTSTNTSQSQTLFEVILRSNGNQITAQSSTNFIPGQQLKIEILPDASIRVLEIIASPLPQQSAIVQQGLREALPLQQKIESLLNNLLILRPLLQQLPPSPMALPPPTALGSCSRVPPATLPGGSLRGNRRAKN